MEIHALSPEEFAVLSDPSESPLIEVVNGMTLAELKQFDNYSPKDTKHYLGIQNKRWVETEKHLISHRPGHGPNVTTEELLEDMEKHHNGLRYRAYYVLRFPEKVRRKDQYKESSIAA